MKEVIIKIYKLNELSEDSKQNAINNIRNILDYPWHNENVASLEEFCRWFNLGKPNYQYGNDRGDFVSADIPSLDEDDIKAYNSLQAYISTTFASPNALSTDCPFTGYCVDESILKPIRECFKDKPIELNQDNYHELMQDCLDNWLKSVNSDYEYYYSDDNISELMEINDYEFTEDGRMYN